MNDRLKQRDLTAPGQSYRIRLDRAKGVEFFAGACIIPWFKEVTPLSQITLEVCCGSVEDVIAAKKAGADRVELNSCLFLGGLTPSVGEVVVAKEMANLPVIAMVRPRQGAFHYTEAEFRTALADATALVDHGADGLVFGFLHEDGTVDTDRCKAVMEIAEGRDTVFHRAIDVVPDWRKALDALIALGVTRVLTSGQEPDVLYGTETVAGMIRHAQGAIQIMPGAGVTERNINRILAETGATQIHVAKFSTLYDHSGRGNPSIYFGGMLFPPEDRYDVIDSDGIGRMRAKL